MNGYMSPSEYYNAVCPEALAMLECIWTPRRANDLTITDLAGRDAVDRSERGRAFALSQFVTHS
jgi:hypothetical protein